MPEDGEFVGERADPLFEGGRTLADLGGAGGFVGQVLVRERQRDIGGHAHGDRRIALRERAACPRHEVQATDDLAVAAERHAQRPAQTGRDSRDLLHHRVLGHVVAQQVIPRLFEQIAHVRRHLDAIRAAEVHVGGQRMDRQRGPVGGQQGQDQRVVRQDAAGDAGEMRKGLADVERSGQQRQQLGQRIESLEQIGVRGHR